MPHSILVIESGGLTKVAKTINGEKYWLNFLSHNPRCIKHAEYQFDTQRVACRVYNDILYNLRCKVAPHQEVCHGHYTWFKQDPAVVCATVEIFAEENEDDEDGDDKEHDDDDDENEDVDILGLDSDSDEDYIDDESDYSDSGGSNYVADDESDYSDSDDESDSDDDGSNYVADDDIPPSVLFSDNSDDEVVQPQKRRRILLSDDEDE